MKVGDKVKLTRNTGYISCDDLKQGDIGTIIEEDHHMWIVESEKGKTRIMSDGLTLVDIKIRNWRDIL